MRTDALTYAVVLPTLYAAHTLADHVLQTDWQARNKASDWRAMAAHVGGYQATQLVAVVGLAKITGVCLSRRGLIAGSLLSALSHALLDRRWPVTRLLSATGSANFARALIDVLPGMVRPGAIRGEQFAHSPPAPLPLHGPYLADQALHTVCLALAAALIARRPSS